jgi:hypothetical protein
MTSVTALSIAPTFQADFSPDVDPLQAHWALPSGVHESPALQNEAGRFSECQSRRRIQLVEIGVRPRAQGQIPVESMERATVETDREIAKFRRARSISVRRRIQLVVTGEAPGLRNQRGSFWHVGR